MPAPAVDSDRRQQVLAAMGIDRWVLRSVPAQGAIAPMREPEAVRVPASAGSMGLEPVSTGSPAAWSALEAAVRDCRACGLHQTRTQTVFGVGNRRARWMIVGEAPGAEEDRQGEPFVGAAGQLLNEMLRAVGLQRGDVFIANVVKCRPPDNRDPKPEEAAACAAHLRSQIRLIAPRLIVAIGRIAAQNLLRQEVAVGRLRGRVHALPEADTPVIVTYHPAYLLRSPLEKRKVWDDLRLALRTVDPRAS